MPDAIDSIFKLMNKNKKSLNKTVYNITSFSPTVLNLLDTIQIKYPNFQLTYSIDKMRQSIVDSWPNFINDEHAKKDWGWNPKYNLDTAFNDYIIPKLGK